MQLMIKTFNYGFEFQSPKYTDICQVICQASSRNVPILYFVILDLFHSYHDYFLQNCTIKIMKCQHNPYLDSIKTSMVDRKLGKFQKAYC